MSLKYRKLQGYKYVLEETYCTRWPELPDLTVHHKLFSVWETYVEIRPGYAWDGASGPTLDTPATMEGALEHDLGFQLLRMGLLKPEQRKIIDWILYRKMQEAGRKIADSRPNAVWRAGARLWNEVRAGYYFAAVRVFGGSAAKPRETEPIDVIHTV